MGSGNIVFEKAYDFAPKTFDSIYSDADEIGKILFSILKTAQIKKRTDKRSDFH